ncbi:MAG: DUF1080 domain-containing protein [Candidatus Solibacter usitatus]|nr:DUF1080 domain-containing protein [Candidatus Solibacter usitatus]
MIFSLLVLAAAAAHGENVLTEAEKQAGWILLFDGRDSSAWKGTASESFPAGCWTVEDGCLRTRTGPEVKIREDLVSRRTFQDFEMAFEVRLTPGANTGVKYLVQDHIPFWNGHDYAVGFEMQLIDDSHPDARSLNRRAGSLYALFAPAKAAARPIGEWNVGRIVKRGKSVEHWLNGEKVVAYRLDDPSFLDSLKTVRATTRDMSGWTKWDCPVSLQHHAGDVWFRNLKIRRLE